MLQLKKINKDYIVGGSKIHALKDINLEFRKSEFVSILGPSGCGKTTLLNIIGGLDHYTTGDLVIDNVSTKDYKDRDWDTYRSHRVGFIFQSYNLIPHQTILENVELALNISGMEKKERVKKAKMALDKVGLKNQYNKKPNQLSGGQCQRVAIARALVNDPEVLLADEPTGALDSETSVQIMNLIQEIAKNCLVIMVTHNPELADKYSTRIIKLLDGQAIYDSNPFVSSDEKEGDLRVKKTTRKKSKLSLWSAFKLSAKNLYSKFKRTFMVCIAGSIGIIGVATVLAISSGVQGYIVNMQNDMLSGNPITISEESIDLSSLISSQSNSTKKNVVKSSIEDGYVNVDSVIEQLIASSKSLSSYKISNTITQDYIDYLFTMPKEYYSDIFLDYGVNLANNVYTEFDFEGQDNNNLSLSSALQIYTSMLNKTEYSEFSQYISTISETFMQAPDNKDFILSQYDIISSPTNSKIATKSNEIMLVVDEDTALSDLLLAQLGYYSQEEFFNIVYKASESANYNQSIWKDKFSYDELIGKTFTWYPNDTIFDKTDESLSYASVNPFSYNAYEQADWTTGKELTITAILRPKKNVSYGCLESGVYFTSALTKEIILDSLTSEIVNYLIANEEDAFNSTSYNGTSVGITYTYHFNYLDQDYTETGFVGSVSQSSAIIGSMTGQNLPTYYTLTMRELGGCNMPSEIKVYPSDFNYKDQITTFLNKWNSDEVLIVNGKAISPDERSDIKFSDNLQLIINLINNLIDIVTTALIAFTALSLVVSTVMVAIITYVSVMERVKEIGVIRSLGGRKRDVSRLFIAETFIIGAVSGIIGIGITYAISGVINLIVGKMFGIYTIASLSPMSAIVMICISIALTLISGLIPANLAAKKDPVEALRTE